MANILKQAIDCDDGDLAAKIIQQALGIESDDIGNYCFPKFLARGSSTAGLAVARPTLTASFHLN
jgi:hypothetical protein